MAIVYGPWETSGTNGMRVGIDISWSAVTYDSTNVTATVKIYTQNIQNYNDNQTLTYTGGSISGTTDYTNNTGSTQGTTSNPDAPRLRATKTYTWTYAAGSYGSSPGSRTFTATVSGAFNGVTPSVTINSTNGGTIPARPATNPSAPTSVSSTPYNGYISVSYGAPTSDGGVPISYYRYSTDNVNFSTTPSNPFNVTGSNGTSITVYVRAVNQSGLESASASTSNTPRTTPSAPTSFTANNSTFGQLTLSWASPTDNGGAGVTAFVLRNGTTVLQNSSSTSYTHTGLSPSTTYSYTVTAVNAAGEGTASSTSATTLGGVSKVWDGSSWVTVFPQIWNGSTWVTSQARVWTGSEWKHAI